MRRSDYDWIPAIIHRRNSADGAPRGAMSSGPQIFPARRTERATHRCEPAAGMKGNTAYRSAVVVALAAAIILVWLSLGVGIIGADGDPANLMYFGVLAVGIIGALIARFRAGGMARALFATALAQASVAAIALIAGLGYPWSGPLELLALNGFFVALFVGSAWLFRRAAHGRPERDAV